MTTARFTRWIPAFALILAAGAANLAGALAGEAHLYLAPYGFDSKFTGDGQISGGNVGSDFDLEDTFDIDPKETVRGVDGFLKFAGSRIDFGYNHGDYTGAETLKSALVFNGVTYGAGEHVHSEFDLTHYRLMYGYDFSLRVVNVGFLVGGHVVDVDARVKSSAAGHEQEELRAPVPVVGVTLGIHPISQIAIHAQISGMSVTISNVKARLIDGFVGVHYLPIPKFGIVAGYRYFVFDGEDKDENDRADIKQRGPYAGIALHL